MIYTVQIQALCKDILHSPLTAKLKVPLKAQEVIGFFQMFGMCAVSKLVCICMHGAENLEIMTFSQVHIESFSRFTRILQFQGEFLSSCCLFRGTCM